MKCAREGEFMSHKKNLQNFPDLLRRDHPYIMFKIFKIFDDLEFFVTQFHVADKFFYAQ